MFFSSEASPQVLGSSMRSNVVYRIPSRISREPTAIRTCAACSWEFSADHLFPQCEGSRSRCHRVFSGPRRRIPSGKIYIWKGRQLELQKTRQGTCGTRASEAITRLWHPYHWRWLRCDRAEGMNNAASGFRGLYSSVACRVKRSSMTPHIDAPTGGISHPKKKWTMSAP